MTNNSFENSALIYDLQILQREIALEGELQLASIARVFAHNIPLLIEKLRRLEAYESGEIIPRSTKEAHSVAVQLHEPRHKAMLMRIIPD